MSIERGQAVVLVVGGMLVGAGVTTLVLKKHYQKIADEEIASVKTAYHDKEKTYKKQTLDLLDIVEEEAAKQDAKSPKTPVPPIAYNKVAVSDERKSEVTALIDDLGYNDPREEPETVVRNISEVAEDGPDAPYIISVDQFMANEEEYDQIVLTYYQGDETLNDDTDQAVDDVRETVGLGNLNRFGEMSGNPDTLYVRNEKRQADFEIIRDYRAYGKDILGIEDDFVDPRLVKEPKPRPRKFRAGD